MHGGNVAAMLGLQVRRIPGQRSWRGIVGLVAAYALALQTLLAYTVTTRAAAQGALFSGSFFVLCIPSDDPAADHDVGAPVKPHTHCPICTLSSGALTLPDPVVQVRYGLVAVASDFVSELACISSHRARAGLSRAPPLSV